MRFANFNAWVTIGQEDQGGVRTVLPEYGLTKDTASGRKTLMILDTIRSREGKSFRPFIAVSGMTIDTGVVRLLE